MSAHTTPMKERSYKVYEKYGKPRALLIATERLIRRFFFIDLSRPLVNRESLRIYSRVYKQGRSLWNTAANGARSCHEVKTSW